MKTMMAMVMAMIFMIWSYVYATFSGGLLSGFLHFQRKITEKMANGQFLRCHELNIVMIVSTIYLLFLESMDLFGTFVAYYYFIN